MAGIECEVLRVPAGELQPSDRIWHMGQWFTVWSVEELERLPPTTHCAFPGILLMVRGEAANYPSQLIIDSRLEIKALFRDMPTNETTKEDLEAVHRNLERRIAGGNS